MAQVISNYAASLPPVLTRMDLCHTVPEGYLGNLTQAQEAKLRALWAIAYKFVETCEADDSFRDAVTLDEKFVPPAMRTGSTQEKTKSSRRKRSMMSLRAAAGDDGNSSHALKKYPSLVYELLSLLPPDPRPLDVLARDVAAALDYWTPHMFRIVILHTVKQEHPDELALRFLRRCRWDIVAACRMMGRTIYWRTMEAAVDDDILRIGEGGAAQDAANGQGRARAAGAEFMSILRSGKGFLHGNDRHGRPISYIRVRLHRPDDHSPEATERYIIYLLEMARLSLRYPVETGTIFIDMTGFKMANFDLSPLKFILKCAQQYYPECIGLILIHKAPYGSKVLWRLVRHWVNADIASKVRFTRSTKQLARYIDPSNILREHGGQDTWQYEYEEPTADENARMDNFATRDYLLLERQMLAERFEAATREWVMLAQRSERADEVARRRDMICADLAANFWELDPYVRARSLYDRRGSLGCATGNLQYHPPKSDLRRRGGGHDSLAAPSIYSSPASSPVSAARPGSIFSSASSTTATRSSVMARSSVGGSGGYSPATSSIGSFPNSSSIGARSSISAAASSGSGTLATCSILGSPVKEDRFAEMERVESIDVRIHDDSSCYSE